MPQIPYRPYQNPQADLGLPFDPNQGPIPLSPEEWQNRQPLLNASQSLQDALGQQNQAMQGPSGVAGILSNPIFQAAVPTALTALSAIFPRHMAVAAPIGMAGFRTVEDLNQQQQRQQQTQASENVSQRMQDFLRQKYGYTVGNAGFDPQKTAALKLEGDINLKDAPSKLSVALQNQAKDDAFNQAKGIDSSTLSPDTELSVTNSLGQTYRATGPKTKELTGDLGNMSLLFPRQQGESTADWATRLAAEAEKARPKGFLEQEYNDWHIKNPKGDRTQFDIWRTQNETNARNAQEDAEIKQAAASIVDAYHNGNPSRLRDVTGFKGTTRLKLFNYMSQMDPSLSTSKLDRMAEMIDSFTVGKDGQAIQSYGTFLVHAANAADAAKDLQDKVIRSGNSQLLNQKLGWWQKNMSGDPAFIAWQAALEPVGKEYESFLLNQHALQSEDRERIGQILSKDATLAQTMAALNQMGHTAVQRASQMNSRYKKTVGSDIPELLDPDAQEAARKLGVALPASAGGGNAGGANASGKVPPPVGSKIELNGKTHIMTSKGWMPPINQ